MNSVENISQLYSEISEKLLIKNFNWADLGSFGSADAYLIPLSSLKGICLCIEGRHGQSDSSNIYRHNKYIKSRIKPVNVFVSGKDEQRFFYESSEGGGSSFYSNQDKVSCLLEGRETKSLVRSIVDTQSLATILEKTQQDYVFIKADLEGAELESIKSVVDKNKNSRPLILEVEINIGERGPVNSIGDGLLEYEKMGYRLVDLRKTYFYPKSRLMPKSTINNDPIFAPYFQGCMHQADLLLVHRDLLLMDTIVEDDEVLMCCLILMLYRQFHLVSHLADMNGSTKLSCLTQDYLARVMNEFKKESTVNQASLWGYNPMFNWLKST